MEDFGGDYNLHLEIWDEQLADCSARILRAVRKLSARLLACNDSIAQITGQEELIMRYRSSVPSVKNQGTKDMRDFVGEIARTGRRGYPARQYLSPHRDDLILSLNGIEVRPYASQGQQRSVVLALKLANCSCCDRRPARAPLLLDDVIQLMAIAAIVSTNDRRLSVISTCRFVTGSD